MQVEDDNEKYYNDYLSRIPPTDPHTLKISIDELRQQYPQAAQDLIKNPNKYYKLTKNHLERNLFGEHRPKFDAKV